MRGDMSATTAQSKKIELLFLSFLNLFDKISNILATGGSVGDCSRDSFSVSSGGASFRGSPVICGTNTGQHSKYAWRFMTSNSWLWLKKNFIF